MPYTKPVKEMDAPTLVRRWKALVNDNVMMGRDAHLFKEALTIYTPVQLMFGIYQMQGNKTVSIPQFLRGHAIWLMDNELDCSIELARLITGTAPKEYWIYRDFENPFSSAELHLYEAAKAALIEWADRILS